MFIVPLNGIINEHLFIFGFIIEKVLHFFLFGLFPCLYTHNTYISLNPHMKVFLTTLMTHSIFYNISPLRNKFATLGHIASETTLFEIRIVGLDTVSEAFTSTFFLNTIGIFLLKEVFFFSFSLNMGGGD